MNVGAAEIITIAGVILGLLLSGNIYFIKRLVDKLDRTAETNEETTATVNQLGRDVSGLGSQLTEIKLDIKELRRVEIEVAVLRAQLNPAKAGAILSGPLKSS